MGFTGKKAAEWKIKYIDAFEKMAKEIKRLQGLLLRQSRQQAKISWQQARLEGKRKNPFEMGKLKENPIINI